MRTDDMQKTRIFKATQVDPPGNCLTYEYDYFVWIHSSNFREIFGSPRTLSGRRNHVKISYGGKTIYRTIETAGCKGVNKDTVGLSYNSLCDLGCNPRELENVELKIEPASGIMSLLHNPDSAKRISFLTTLASFVLGLIVGILF